jgi:hypothetical protein
MVEFRRRFEAVFWAATLGPQLITSRGAPAYAMVPETGKLAIRMKVDRVVTLHKLKPSK